MKLKSIILFSSNPKLLTEFYRKVLNMEPDWINGEYADFKAGDTYFEIGPHSEVISKNLNPQRCILNFHVEDVESEFERIEKSGAKVIKEVYTPKEDTRLKIATFADPDGNYFQIMSDWTLF